MVRGCTCADEETVAAVCAAEVEALTVRLRRHLRRPEAAAHAADYLRGLVAEVERKNGWQLAARAGYGHPRGIQRVLDRSTWDADAMRDDLRAYVVTALGDPAGVLVVDETGFPKQGRHSAGVARQYCGTLGKRANCQGGCSSATPARRGMRGSTAPSTCLRSGPLTAPAAARRASQTRYRSRPSHSWRWRWSSAPLLPGCPRRGW